ncbi:hypothetical protein [Anaeromyxobacter terrae]|uniref:hypothetical protein n=1 Tax=Anaeromyxobacter terrae TaxID=2925406 RepID=UPI001F55F7B0|nr:hypothetical protein [Anaeromyxobacter sp. SG22]
MMVLLAIALLAGSGNSKPPAGWVPSLLDCSPQKCTFADIRTHLGDVPVSRSREGEPQLCYAAERRGDGAAVVFQSVADYVELGVTSIRLVAAPPPTATCKAIKGITAAIAFSNGLRLGLTRAEVRRLLGPPDSSSGRALKWSRNYEVPLPPQMRERILAIEGEEALRAFPNLSGVASIAVVFGFDARADDISVTRLETY